MRFHTDLASPLAGTVPQPTDSTATCAQTSLRQIKRIAYAVVLLDTILTVLVTPSLAQLSADISGVLTLPSGAAVPGATLALPDQDAALVSATVKSDASGKFTFLCFLAPGT